MDIYMIIAQFRYDVRSKVQIGTEQGAAVSLMQMSSVKIAPGRVNVQTCHKHVVKFMHR